MHEENGNLQKSIDDDGFWAGILLFAVISVAFVLMVYVWSKKTFSNTSIKLKSAFAPPHDREIYILNKSSYQPNVVSSVDKMKKLLMKRAIQNIPILLSLQNEGSSIERLYKRGMLTDDMHFKVKELKTFVDQEFQDVQYEADELVEGWGAHIWPQAMQFHQMIQKQSESNSEKKLNNKSTQLAEADKQAKQLLKEEADKNADVAHKRSSRNDAVSSSNKK